MSRKWWKCIWALGSWEGQSYLLYHDKHYNVRVESAATGNVFCWEVNLLTLFGSIAVVIMMISYWLEHRSKWFVLLFSFGCATTSAYSVLVQAFPITVIEGIWALVAVQRFVKRYRKEGVKGLV